MIRVLLALILAPPLFADDPPLPAPSIRLPEPTAPVLPPAPNPSAPTVLNADELYVFDSDVECFVAGYPVGLLKVTTEAGPVRVKARFAGNTTTSTRTYKGPFVYVVEAVTTGDATLVVTPKGVDKAEKILTRLISANVGPRPPPPGEPTAKITVDPLTVAPGEAAVLKWATENVNTVMLGGEIVPPNGTRFVKPTQTTTYTLTASAGDGRKVTTSATVTVGAAPPDPSLVTNPFGDLPGLRVLIVYETGSTLPIGQQPVLFGKEVRDYLDAHCPVGPDGATKEWRIYDQNVTGLENEAPVWKAVMAKPRVGVPWLYVGNGKAGESVALPKTTAEAMTLLRKYGGA